MADTFLMLHSLSPGFLSYGREFRALSDLAGRQYKSRPGAKGTDICARFDSSADSEVVAA